MFESSWYAVYVQVRHEKIVEQQLSRKGIESFLPMVPVWSRRKDRRKKIDSVLFPGYCFVRIRLDDHSHVEVLRIPGALTILRNSQGPLSIPAFQVESLQTMLGAAQPITIYSCLHEGDRVKVVRGPLAGCTGILTRLDEKKGRLTVNVDIFGKSVSCELNVEDVG